jgi:hypothetical protein
MIKSITRNKFAFYLILFNTFSCFNPFFPPTDNPPVSSTLRSTPQGIIKQLVDAYQKKDLVLYKELFSGKQDFRFYVPQGFSSPNVITTCEKVDSICFYVLAQGLTCLNYWTYTEEMKSHMNLFNPDNTEQIRLTLPTLDPADVRYIISDKNETTYVELLISGGQLEINGKVQIDNEGNRYQDQFTVDDIGKQVFYLERDPDNHSLWVIFKWFDLSAF